MQVHQGEVSSDKLQKGGIVTAVANHKEMLLGQKLRLEGHWIKHKKYGSQLEVILLLYRLFRGFYRLLL